MKYSVGIDLGSTTTKAVLLDEEERVLGRGITNSRSNYETACSVATEEAKIDARFSLFRREFGGEGALDDQVEGRLGRQFVDQHVDRQGGPPVVHVLHHDVDVVAADAKHDGVAGLGIGAHLDPGKLDLFELLVDVVLFVLARRLLDHDMGVGSIECE